MNSEVRQEGFWQNPVSLFTPFTAYLFSFPIFQLSAGSVTEIWLQIQGVEPTVMYQFCRKVNEGFYESQSEWVKSRLYKINGYYPYNLSTFVKGTIIYIYILVFMFRFHYWTLAYYSLCWVLKVHSQNSGNSTSSTPSRKPQSSAPKVRKSVSSRIHEAVKAIALCHNVTPVYESRAGVSGETEYAEVDQDFSDENRTYQASSPDEVSMQGWKN